MSAINLVNTNILNTLSLKEQFQYKLASKLLKNKSVSEMETVLISILVWKTSLRFKNLISQKHIELHIAQIWGWRHFSPKGLVQLIERPLNHHMNKLDRKQALAFLNNPSALRKIQLKNGEKVTPLSYFFSSPEVNMEDKNILAKIALNSSFLTYPIARNILNGVDLNQDSLTTFEPIRVNILNWARQGWEDLELPDSCVEGLIFQGITDRIAIRV
jgi:hypothetical protein